MKILDRIRSPVVVRKIVAFGMSVGEITQALQFRDRRGRRAMDYAMPSTALHGLDIVDPIIDECGPRGARLPRPSGPYSARSFAIRSDIISLESNPMIHSTRVFLLTILLGLFSIAGQGATAHKPVKVPLAAQKAVDNLYAAPDAPLLWFAAGRPTASALRALAELTTAETRGLDPADYELPALRELLTSPTAPADPQALRALEQRLSRTVAHLVADLHAGRIAPREVGHDLDAPHAALDLSVAVRALAGARDPKAVLDDFEPGFQHYDLLKAALRRYRELALDTTLTNLPPLPTRTVKPGESYAGAAALRRLLTALGDLPSGAAAADDTTIDATLTEALRKFQDRHGVNIDGALGAATFRLLTTPLTRRVRQIEYSLERARWLPPRLDSPPILVNIPQFRLFAFSTASDREDTLLQMKVVVGKIYPRNNTPVFAADLRYIVLRPYWDVPRSILRDELLPRIEANTAWLAANNFEIVAGAGDDGKVAAATPDNIAALRAGTLRLRQKPGGGNALGVAKFLFPNSHNVYLHGTTAQGLFAEARRAFSHGCIRVEDPLRLAEFVLRNDPNWNRAALDAAAMNSTSRRINLATPVRVFIMYATAIATEAGNVLFFEDIYGHDAKLGAALARHQRR